MNARSDSSSEPSRGSLGGRLLLSAAVLFALAATAALILTDEQRWLRLGIVAALWAALAGAFVAARYRRQVADQQDVLAERHERYQLELEREIAARREYELEVAAEAHRQADEEARDDIAGLRQELLGLRQTLEGLLGGEFLVERYALRAESTRMRSLSDDLDLKRLPPATAIVQDAQTDLIEAIGKASKSANRKVEPLPRRPDRPAGRTQVPRPAKSPVVDAGGEPWQQVHPAELSDRWFVPDGVGTNQPPKPAQPTRRGDRKADPNRRNSVASGYVEPVGRADANGFEAAASGHLSAAEPPAFGAPAGRPVSSDFGPAASRAESSGFGSPVRRNGAPGPGAAESSGYGPAVSRNGSAGHSAAEASGFGQPVGRDSAGYGAAEASGFGRPVGRNGAAESSGYGSPVGRNGAGYGAAEASGFGQPVGRNGAGYGSAESSGFGPAVGRNGAAGYGPAESSGFGPAVGRNGAAGYGPAESSGYGQAVGHNGPAGPPGYRPSPGPAESSGYGPALTRAESSGISQAVSRPQPGPTPTPDAGGRRRRAEGQPTWQETRDGRPDDAAAEPSGSHAAGRSVSELLASHGGDRPSTPRRRRRKE
ncbi:DUF6779 domain-containing protein [Actinophytocola sediminis]